MSPDISIVMPVYNTGALLAEAIRSAIAQETSAAWELVIVDDRSDDSVTRRLLAESPGLDARIRVIANTGPKGPGAARNAGIAAARAPWLAFLDSDDVWPAGSLQRRWARATSRPDVQWIAGNYASWFPDGTLVLAGKPMQARFPPGETEMLLRRPVEILIGYTPLAGTALIRKEVIEQTGGFDPDVFYGDDWLLNLKLAAATDLVFLSDVLLHLRRHGQPSVMGAGGYFFGICKQAIPAALRHPALASYRPALRRHRVDLLLDIAEELARQAQPLQAMRARLRALATTPSDVKTWRRVLASMVRPPET
jgi:glycosyltransferase involved in cell wall biosynthesis